MGTNLILVSSSFIPYRLSSFHLLRLLQLLLLLQVESKGMFFFFSSFFFIIIFPCATKKRQTGRKLTFYRRGNQVYTCQVLVQILFAVVVSLSLWKTTTDKERSDRRFLALDCHPLFPCLLLLSWCCKDAYTTTTGRSYHWKQQQVHTLNISHREWIRRRHWKETGNECDSWGFFPTRKSRILPSSLFLLALYYTSCIYFWVLNNWMIREKKKESEGGSSTKFSKR